jgi:hypothetical protein
MVERTFARLKIEDLEKLFDEKRSNKDVLTSLLGELSHQTMSRAKALRRRVTQALGVERISKENIP